MQTEKIVLIDGREIECWQAVANEEACCEMDDKEIRKMFENNAFLLFENRERILSDSRMFLCPVPLKNNFMGMKNRTIGVYIEWWMKFEQTRALSNDGVQRLVCWLAGSPCTGTNGCTAIRADGKLETVELHPFHEHWSTFVKINQRYDDAKSRYQAYTFQQVLEILKEENRSKSLVEELAEQHPVLTEDEMRDFPSFEEIIADAKLMFDEKLKNIIQEYEKRKDKNI